MEMLANSIWKLSVALGLLLTGARLQAETPGNDNTAPQQLSSASTAAAIPVPTTAPASPTVAELTSLSVMPCNFTLAAEEFDALAAQSTFPGVLEKSDVPATLPSGVTKPVASTKAIAASSSAVASAASACPNNCCEGADCTKCCKCGPPGDFWIRQEYVGWWAEGGRLPTLVATSPDDTLPATIPLYGNDVYNGGYRSGLWTQAGMWFDCCHTSGIMLDYFYVGEESSPFFASSNGDPILTRPFTDANTGDPAEQLIAVPGIVVGNVSVANYNSLQGAGASFRCNLCCCEDCCDCCDSWCNEDCSRLDFLYGFRFYNFDDNLEIREMLTSIDPQSGVPIGTQFDIRDRFATRNNFYGGEIGLVYQRYRGRWMTEGTAKVALGAMNSLVTIDGSTAVSFPGQPTAFNEGGLLALSSNIGQYEENSFTAIPQFSLRLGYRVTERLTLMAGYTLMYFSNIARAGDQIDTVINPNLIPPPVSGGPARPAFNFNPSDLVLQGITLGGEFTF